MNQISALLQTPFSSRTLAEKLDIKKLGRPLPNLNLQQQTKNRCRKFNPEIYNKNKWICGSQEVNAFFCFPCVLFGGDVSWTKTGIRDIGHIWSKIKVHESSKRHMDNVLSFSFLGKVNIQNKLDSQYRQTIINHNEQVDKNRYVLNLIINCIRFCGALELALRGHDETGTSENKGVFRELIQFSAELDKDLKVHLSQSSVFKGISKTIQNELLETMLQVYHVEVSKEIRKADYVAIIADETTDVSCNFQLVIVLRYIVDGRPIERFWNFIKPEGQNAHAIADSIFTQIDPLISDQPAKLIAQSYDGASVMSGGLNGVQKLIKDKYPNANFIHCYAHQFNLIMSAAASVNRQARIFFAHLSGICSFFSHSPQRSKVLHDIIEKSLPRVAVTRWNYHSRVVKDVFENREDLIKVMESIESNETIKLPSTIEKAGAYKQRLKDSDFIFWLTFFYKIMPHVDIIFSQLQKRITDPVKVKQDIQNFEEVIQKIRDNIDEILVVNETNSKRDESLPSKRQRIGEDCRKRDALEVCDAILSEIKARFQFTGHLTATNLFAVKCFDKYIKSFPDQYLDEMTNIYSFLDKRKLKGELQVFYARPELRPVSGAVPFLSLILEDDLCDTFEETIKILKLLITMPVSTSEAERCFSMLKRIKTFLRNTMKEERLSALGMLSCEKSFVNKIEGFNAKVIDLFASKKERRMDFQYRSY